jgi:quercetin dioxygenase-like cupin family protein
MRSMRSFAAGTVVGATVMSFGLAAFGEAQQSPAKVVLENDRVRVRDVTFLPGVKDTGMHTHDLPHVGVILTAGALTFSEPGKPSETVKYTPGAVGFREANVTHQVVNPGTAPMRVIEVEVK